jgi:hypothetical protein
MGSRVRVPPRSPIKSNSYDETFQAKFPKICSGKHMGSDHVSHPLQPGSPSTGGVQWLNDAGTDKIGWLISGQSLFYLLKRISKSGLGSLIPSR